MAFARVIRRSASSITPLVSRLVQGQRQHHSAVLTALYHTALSHETYSSPFRQTFNYSSSVAVKKRSSDESLIRVIESEIQCAVEADGRIEEIPDGFPFEIQDNPGEQFMSMKREYQGEIIEVDVHMPNLDGVEDGEDADDDENDKKMNIPMVVTVCKKSGGSILEFSCTAFPEEIVIDSLGFKDPEHAQDQFAYEGPDFMNLDESLKKSLHKYLEMRGIKPSTTNFLYECIINKDNREYLMWLKKLKNFIEE